MAEHGDEHERTLAFAEIALGQIKALRQPAHPRNYEIWYTYATGYNPSLNQTINETLARNGTLTAEDLDEIRHEKRGADRRFSRRMPQSPSRVVARDSALAADCSPPRIIGWRLRASAR